MSIIKKFLASDLCPEIIRYRFKLLDIIIKDENTKLTVLRSMALSFIYRAIIKRFIKRDMKGKYVNEVYNVYSFEEQKILEELFAYIEQERLDIYAVCNKLYNIKLFETDNVVKKIRLNVDVTAFGYVYFFTKK